jgi:formylglycine-generating enzyme
MFLLLALGCSQTPIVDKAPAVEHVNLMEMIRIPAGQFTMGTPLDEKHRLEHELQHEVILTRDFYILKTEVSQDMWKEVMDVNPSKFDSCGSCPVDSVSWNHAVIFANRMSEKEGLDVCYNLRGESAQWLSYDCNGYRLPTEAEWEYSARGKAYQLYSGSDILIEVGWYAENSEKKTHAGCGRNQNGFGLCDMSGNVYEWVWDWEGPYQSGSVTDPIGAEKGNGRIYRGGGYFPGSRRARVGSRYHYPPGDSLVNLGFRVARTAD